MMKRQTIKDWRWVTGKMDYHPSAQRERQLADSHLEALDKLDEAQKIAEWLIAEERWKVIREVEKVYGYQFGNDGQVHRDRYASEGAYIAHRWWNSVLGGAIRDLKDGRF